jgi:hypothetical protein
VLRMLEALPVSNEPPNVPAVFWHRPHLRSYILRSEDSPCRSWCRWGWARSVVFRHLEPPFLYLTGLASPYCARLLQVRGA